MRAQLQELTGSEKKGGCQVSGGRKGRVVDGRGGSAVGKGTLPVRIARQLAGKQRGSCRSVLYAACRRAAREVRDVPFSANGTATQLGGNLVTAWLTGEGVVQLRGSGCNTKKLLTITSWLGQSSEALHRVSEPNHSIAQHPSNI